METKMADSMTAREATAEEWADRLVGRSRQDISAALKAAEARGRREGSRPLRSAANHFEVAYRYAVNASRSGADTADLLQSAETFAKMGYDGLRKAEG